MILPVPGYRHVNSTSRDSRKQSAGKRICSIPNVPIPLQKRIVYGPVGSRRLGASLGVNVLPHNLKICNMNCAYCQYGWTNVRRSSSRSPVRWPTPGRIEAAVAARLKRAAASNEILDRITVAGHGEPTLHPDFEEIAMRLARIRDAVSPGLRLAILSNSTTASWPNVRRGLAYFDERHMKLDAGDPITYARINQGGVSIRTLIESLADLPDIIVQAMFVSDVSGRIDNANEAAVAEWLLALERVRPAQVHIYTVDRSPADVDLKPVPAVRLREIAERVRAAGFSAQVFAGRRN